MILLVLVALVARVDAAPGEADAAPPVRDAKLLTGTDAANDRRAGQADDANLADEVGEADDADVADELDDADDADVADDADDAREDNPEAVSEDDPGAEGPGNPDPRDLDPSAPRALERLVLGADGDDPADGDGATDDAAGQLAMREAEQAPAGTSPDDDANAAASPAGALETYEAWIRHPRLSRLGRLDVSLAWRQLWSEPMHTMPHRADSVWLVATWRR